MKFNSKVELSNGSKEIREILSVNLRNSIDDLVDAYGFDEEMVDSLSYSLYVNHTDKLAFKAGRTKFVKVYEKSVNKLIETGTITFEELGFLTYLSTAFTTHEDNYLRIDGKLVGKNELIDYMVKSTDIGMSESSLRRKFKSVEEKYYLLVDDHPSESKKNIYYLSPFIFYKGKFIDNSARKALFDIYRQIHSELLQLKSEGKLNIDINSNFDQMSDEDILVMCAKK